MLLSAERNYASEMLQTHAASAQKIAAVQTPFSAEESDVVVSESVFSTVEIALIGAEIARGEKKTNMVRGMPGYDTRKHRLFAAYYTMLYKDLGERAILSHHSCSPQRKA
jgi:hypothetical protein